MKEEEAKGKWCPQKKPAKSMADYTDNVDRCIGSKCMAWRWYSAVIKNGGYCGLAGEPK